MGSRVERTHDKAGLGGIGGGWQSEQSHICVWINREEQLGSETDHATQDSRAGEIKPQNL